MQSIHGDTEDADDRLEFLAGRLLIDAQIAPELPASRILLAAAEMLVMTESGHRSTAGEG